MKVWFGVPRTKGGGVQGCRNVNGRSAILVWVFALTSSGCSFGPKVLERTHSQYNESIRRVNEEQLLQNILRIRYNEMPFRLNVSSIAAQYELAGSAEARPFFLAPNPSGSIFKTFTSVLPDVSLSGANRPTITFLPAGGDVVRRFLTPISADTLVFLASTSWPASTILRLWADRLNGVPNATSGPQRELAPDYARFQRIVELLQVAQDLELAVVSSEEIRSELGGSVPAGSVTAVAAVEAAKNNLEYRPRGDGSSWTLVRKQRGLVLVINPLAVGNPMIRELEDLLNLQPGRQKYEIAVATDVADPRRFPTPASTSLKLTPRSTSQVYFYLSNGVEVPPEHVAEGIIRPAIAPDRDPFDERVITAGLFAVHACKGHKPPPNAYLAVKYRDYWYYIDDRDQASKTTFALVLELSRLDFGVSEATSGPFLTLPVGR